MNVCIENKIKVNKMENTEKMLQDKGLNAPRLTPEVIDNAIEKAEYHRLTGVLTVCVLTLKNGFTVTGESACASPENYNEEIGNKIAFDNAREKIWQLVGFLLVDKLAENKIDFCNATTKGVCNG